MDFWQQVYHLSGLTLLDMTKEEPLGSLPIPLRSAALAVAERMVGHAVQVEWGDEEGFAASYRYVKQWRRRPPEHESEAAPASSATASAPRTLHEYFEQHRLLPCNEKQDEHFAERLFVERVFVPLFGMHALVHLQPQVAFFDPNG